LLPTLQIDDISKDIEMIGFEKSNVCGVPVRYYNQPTNGIMFFKIKVKDVKND
jgi:hypothetical protein